MPSSIFKVLIPTIHQSPVHLHWYHHRSPVRTRELRVGRSLSSQAFSKAKDPSLYRPLVPSESSPLGMVLPLPRSQRGRRLLLLVPQVAPTITKPERGTVQVPGGTYHCSEPRGPPPGQPRLPESGSRAPRAGEAKHTYILQGLLGWETSLGTRGLGLNPLHPGSSHGTWPGWKSRLQPPRYPGG